MLPQISKTITLATYQVGSAVEESGCYICVPCGYKKYLSKGSRFPRCLKCMGKREEFIRGLELWERYHE